MALVILFLLTGLALSALLIAKRIEEKKKRTVLVLKLISTGDERVRELHHELANRYSLIKERAYFFVAKRIPRYSKSSFNKILARLEENAGKHLDRLRDAKLLKKSEGISEFFKSMSEVERGIGEINEEIYAEEPTTYNLRPTTDSVQMELVEKIVEKPKRVRKPIVRKIKVTEEVSGPIL